MEPPMMLVRSRPFSSMKSTIRSQIHLRSYSTSGLSDFPKPGGSRGDGDGTIAYSHAIDVVDKDYIVEHYEAYGGTVPPEPLDHEGINDVFIEKASEVFYWHNDSWLKLRGAD